MEGSVPLRAQTVHDTASCSLRGQTALALSSRWPDGCQFSLACAWLNHAHCSSAVRFAVQRPLLPSGSRDTV